MLAVSRSACRATGPDHGRLDPFHPGSGPVTPMVTVLRSQSSRHFLRSQGREDQRPRRQNHRRRRAPNRVLVSRVEDEVRPRPEQVGRQRDHDEPRTALCRRRSDSVCQQRLMIYQLVESQVHRQGFHASDRG